MKRESPKQVVQDVWPRDYSLHNAYDIGSEQEMTGRASDGPHSNIYNVVVQTNHAYLEGHGDEYFDHPRDENLNAAYLWEQERTLLGNQLSRLRLTCWK